MEEFGALQMDRVCALMDYPGTVTVASHVQAAKCGTVTPIHAPVPVEPIGMDLSVSPALLA